MRFAFRGGHNPVDVRISARSRLRNEPLRLTAQRARPAGVKIGLAGVPVVPAKKRPQKGFVSHKKWARALPFLLSGGRIFLLESRGLPVACWLGILVGHPWGSARTA
jgi:hypothetical protein